MSSFFQSNARSTLTFAPKALILAVGVLGLTAAHHGGAAQAGSLDLGGVVELAQSGGDGVTTSSDRKKKRKKRRLRRAGSFRT